MSSITSQVVTLSRWSHHFMTWWVYSCTGSLSSHSPKGQGKPASTAVIVEAPAAVATEPERPKSTEGEMNKGAEETGLGAPSREKTPEPAKTDETAEIQAKVSLPGPGTKACSFCGTFVSDTNISKMSFKMSPCKKYFRCSGRRRGNKIGCATD